MAIFLSEIAGDERRRAGVVILVAFSSCILEVTLVSERVASLHLLIGGEILTVVCANGPNSSSAYPPFLY